MSLISDWRFLRRLFPSFQVRQPEAPELRRSVAQPVFGAPAPREPVPTESEANLRADLGPDPLHPEHKEAA